jgi:hypothetical protein
MEFLTTATIKFFPSPVRNGDEIIKFLGETDDCLSNKLQPYFTKN